MSKYWSQRVHALQPYVPGEQPKLADLVKLNTNESPFGPSPKALAAMREACSDDLRLYPDPNADALKAAIARRFSLSSAEVFVGNGSDEVLAHCFYALFDDRRPILFPDISYSFYPVYCGLYGLRAEPVALDEDFRIRVEDYRRDNGGIIFPNPNAPTGIVLGLPSIEQLLNDNPDTVVVVDEAYIDFDGRTAASLIARHPNLLVVQTLSKSRALAGLRVGFALGQAPLIEGLERVKNSFNSYPLSRVAQAGALAAIEDEAYLQDCCQRVCANRQQLSEALQQRGFEVLPSGANFVFARHCQRDAAQLAQGLRQHAVIVRHFRQARIEQFLRITVGTELQHRALLQALDQLLA